MSTRAMPSILGISGSLRKGSYTSAILSTLAETCGDRARFKQFSLRDIPLYDQDLDHGSPPAAVAALRSAISDAHGIVIGSPEYNHGISGVLKNALDWASRPFGRSSLTGKPVLTFTSSIAFTGGVRAQTQLNETLIAIAAQLVLRPQIVIGTVQEKIRDGRLCDEASLAFVKGGVDDLIRRIIRKTHVMEQEA